MNVYENRLGADRVNVEEISRIVVSGQEDFVARPNLQRPQRQLDGESAARANEGELHAVISDHLAGEALDVGTVIFAPGTVRVGGLESVENIVIRDRPFRR